MENRQGAVSDQPIRRGLGRLLLDAVSETVLSCVFFVLRFIAWGIQWTLATALLLLVMAGAGYYVFMEALDGGQYVTVPSIERRLIGEAFNEVAAQGLELGTPLEMAHATIPKYYVISQRPAAGRVVRTGRKVYPTVSMGANYLAAPALLRKSLDDARSEALQTRFRIGRVARMPHRSPRDTVIAQDPPEGAEIANQGEIHLLVSAGAEKSSAFMPDIRGMNVQEVLRVLAPFGLTLMPNEVGEGEAPGALEDVVLNQDPPPQTLISEGQTVTYDVKPSGTIAIPDARHIVEVRHRFDYDWFDRDIRVDVLDRRGNRQTVWEMSAAFDEASRAQRVKASFIRFSVKYIKAATVEIYVNEQLMESYYLIDGAPPIKSMDPNHRSPA